MPPEPLDYASGPAARRTPPGWLLVLRQGWRDTHGWLARHRRLVIAIILCASAATAAAAWFWRDYLSPNGRQLQRMLAFTRPPDWVVYEEDHARAARLRALPADPATEFVGEDTSHIFESRYPNVGDSEYFTGGVDKTTATYIPRFHAYTFSPWGAGGLTFVHKRGGAFLGARMVMVTHGTCHPARDSGAEILWDGGSSQTRRDGLILAARSGPVTGPYDRLIHRWKPVSYIRIPLGPRQVGRLYAGQVDPADDARLTIRYEIDGVAGTIEGKLNADNSVTLRVVDGPAAATWQTVVPGTYAGQWRTVP